MCIRMNLLPPPLNVVSNCDIVVHQFTVRAYDTGQPPLEDFELVMIVVNRNLHSPNFFVLADKVRILETKAVNTAFYHVDASDSDLRVSPEHVKYKCLLYLY